MHVASREGRATINNVGEQVCIKIPTAKNVLKIVFLGAWLGAWFLGETSAIQQVVSGKSHSSDFFMLFWLCGWTIGGGWAILTLLWNAAGREEITVGQGMIKIKKTIWGIGLSREYTLSSTRDFRVVSDHNSDSAFNGTRGLGFWGYICGPIVFDYGMKTIKFGLGIDEAEARYIIEVLAEKGFIKH
jgi:hypothetical protein